MKEGRTVYTASAQLVATLPNNRIFPPTFHSCYISRVYVLKLQCSVGLIRKPREVLVSRQLRPCKYVHHEEGKVAVDKQCFDTLFVELLIISKVAIEVAQIMSLCPDKHDR